MDSCTNGSDWNSPTESEKRLKELLIGKRIETETLRKVSKRFTVSLLPAQLAPYIWLLFYGHMRINLTLIIEVRSEKNVFIL